MNFKRIKQSAAAGLSALLLLSLNIPVAEASWGAAKLLNKQSPVVTAPSAEEHYSHPNNNNSDISSDSGNEFDITYYLKNKNMRYSLLNNIPVPSQDPQITEQPSPQKQPQLPEETNNNSETLNLDQECKEMLSMVNSERIKNGLKPLSLHGELTDLAQKKSRDMVINNYFSHTSPTLGSFYEMVYNAGIPFKQVGENLAMAGNIYKAHMLLMASEGHRNNLLDPRFTHIGIGIAHNTYGVVVTQLFISQ